MSGPVDDIEEEVDSRLRSSLEEDGDDPDVDLVLQGRLAEFRDAKGELLGCHTIRDSDVTHG